jgi:uncharacterized protein YecE (DUF72 family)
MGLEGSMREKPSLNSKEFYSKHFDTVEINNSFYKLRYENSPGKMLLAIKANRFITHMRKLTQPDEPITRLFGSIEALKEKLGPILFQPPPKRKKRKHGSMRY